MFKNMKPLPKFVLLAAVVGIPFAAYVKFVPQKPPAPAVEVVAPVTVPAESAQAPVASSPAPAPPAPPQATAPAAPSGLTPAGGQDAGLNAVLNAGKK